MIMMLAGTTLAANAGQLSDPGNLSQHVDAPANDWEGEGLLIGDGQMRAGMEPGHPQCDAFASHDGDPAD